MAVAVHLVSHLQTHLLFENKRCKDYNIQKPHHPLVFCFEYCMAVAVNLIVSLQTGVLQLFSATVTTVPNTHTAFRCKLEKK